MLGEHDGRLHVGICIFRRERLEVAVDGERAEKNRQADAERKRQYQGEAGSCHGCF